MKNKKKTGGKARPIAIIVAIVLALVVVVGALMAIPTTQTTEFALVINNEYILTEKKNVVIKRGDVIEVDIFDGEGEVDVEVYAIKNTKRNLTFTYAGREFSWNESGSIANCPVGRCFEFDIIQPDGKKDGTITYQSGDEYDVIETLVGSDAYEITNGASVSGDLFRLDVTVGTSTVCVYFSVQATVRDIEIDQNQIIF